MLDKTENYITREEFEQFVQFNELRYSSLFNRILGLDMTVRSIILPLATSGEIVEKARDIIELLDNIKTNLVKSGGIAEDHQKDMFFTLDHIVDMLQNTLKRSENIGESKDES
ncbi:hypothetical protein [Mannheimia indoligenes]|uniref:hypothetical protein n=1 Tax=Mannheimia indoligenes TaxID=3103145 RepID=UPI002FE5E92B